MGGKGEQEPVCTLWGVEAGGGRGEKGPERNKSHSGDEGFGRREH